MGEYLHAYFSVVYNYLRMSYFDHCGLAKPTSKSEIYEWVNPTISIACNLPNKHTNINWILFYLISVNKRFFCDMSEWCVGEGLCEISKAFEHNYFTFVSDHLQVSVSFELINRTYDRRLACWLFSVRIICSKLQTAGAESRRLTVDWKKFCFNIYLVFSMYIFLILYATASCCIGLYLVTWIFTLYSHDI